VLTKSDKPCYYIKAVANNKDDSKKL